MITAKSHILKFIRVTRPAQVVLGVGIALCALSNAWLRAADVAAPGPAELEAVVTTEMGSFRFEFYPEQAPKHVERFIRFARDKYYDGGAFHRVGKAFIQGGDPNMKEKNPPRELWGKGGFNLGPDMLEGELSELKNLRGTVSTVRQYKPRTESSQFIVCVDAVPLLDGGFTQFGHVTQGMDVVDRIAHADVENEVGIVKNPVRILKITIEPKKTAVEPKVEPKKITVEPKKMGAANSQQ
jgi:peptidyl-prolyl cis-trans isomerase B (cyclophilin B)